MITEETGMKIFKLWLGTWLAVCTSMVYASESAVAGREKSATCAGCHGEDGNSLVPIFPKLAGQHASYLVKQLADFKSQKRVEPTMNAIAEALSQEDMHDIAAFYSTQKLITEKNPPNAEGEKVYRYGNPETGLPACSGCHSPDGSGNPQAIFPRLHGQQVAYVEKTLHDFKAGERANDMNAMMRTIAAKMTDKEMTAVADYISSLHK